MKFTVEISDHEGSYVVRLEDGTCAMVNLDFPDTIVRGKDPEELLTRGFWPYDDVEPLTDERLNTIEEILKANM
ncbi:MAG: hypothetical protein K6C96_01990 [Butyrivibrio sp.]|nr:hypothetical protein [Butyrivibrio sp.]